MTTIQVCPHCGAPISTLVVAGDEDNFLAVVCSADDRHDIDAYNYQPVDRVIAATRMTANLPYMCPECGSPSNSPFTCLDHDPPARAVLSPEGRLSRIASERDQYRAALERVTERPEYAAKIAFGALEGKD